MWEWVPMLVSMVVLACMRVVDPHRAALRYYSEHHMNIYILMRGIEFVLLAASVYPLKHYARKAFSGLVKELTSRT